MDALRGKKYYEVKVNVAISTKNDLGLIQNSNYCAEARITSVHEHIKNSRTLPLAECTANRQEKFYFRLSELDYAIITNLLNYIHP